MSGVERALRHWDARSIESEGGVEDGRRARRVVNEGCRIQAEAAEVETTVLEVWPRTARAESPLEGYLE
jgi:hypothetical protein